ncbi:MAG: aminoacyl--tRNA ligase-related protein [Nitrososphaeria archaeon]
MARIRIKADGYFKLSKSHRDVSKVVENSLAEVRTTLMRGSDRDPVNACYLNSWSVSDNVLNVQLVSGNLVRAHVGMLRLKKVLAKNLGEKLKIGIRELGVRKLDITLDQKMDDISINKVKSMPKVGNVFPAQDNTIIELQELRESDLRENLVDRLITLVEEVAKEKHVTFKQVQPIVKVSEKKEMLFTGDPLISGLELGWIVNFPGRGQFIYTSKYGALFEAIKSILVEEIVKKIGFKPFLLPKLIPFDVMKKMPGYFDTIPEGMFYVSPPPREPEAFDTFKQEYKITKEIPMDELKRILKDPAYVLAPAQCEPFWQYYSVTKHDLPSYPLKYYDASGYTYRWEGGGLEGLVRVTEFQRIELTYVGLPTQVVDIRDHIVERGVYVADKQLDLEWRVTAAAPFYVKESSMEFDPYNSVEVPAYDIEIYLPYRGPREESEWLEVAGCFVHKKKFVDSFKIKGDNSNEIWTGCTGLGLSRWVAAFLAEKGFKEENWPAVIREKYEDALGERDAKESN